jgi:alanine racemase
MQSIMPILRRTSSLVFLQNLRYNIAALRRHVGPKVKVLLVVKADAYGHGIVPCSVAAQEEKVDWLGVALAEEGMQVRQAGVSLPILVFGALNAEGMDCACEHGLTIPLPDAHSVHLAQAVAEKYNKTIDAHIKLDTGMGRIGARTPEEVQSILQTLVACPRVKLKGVFTHLANADGEDRTYTDMQLKRFAELRAPLPQGLLVHMAASGGAMFRPDTHFGMVRVGTALYGYPPEGSPVAFKPCIRISAEITFVKHIEPGESVSYGCTFTASKSTKVATIAVGYGDGYPRALSNKGRVLIHGQSCPIIGRVCMDQFMVDASGVENVQPGETAVLIGRQGQAFIGADELARTIGTVTYDILLSPGSRIPKRYTYQPEE